MSFVAYVLTVIQRVFAAYLPWAPVLGKRVSLSSTALLPHEQGRPSVAQRCNEDVLGEIFAELPPNALASAALVCQSWLHPARVKLYRNLYLNNFGSPHTDKLADILPVHPLLRSLVRRPTLSHAGIGRLCPTLFDWIALLPEQSFQSVDIRTAHSSKQKPLPTLAALLDFPAVRTTPRLIVRCRMFITPKRLDQVLGLPCLESLSLMISEGTTIHLKDITVYPQNLRRLSIRADVFSPLFAKLLYGLPSPLERFDLQCDGMKLLDINVICYALQQHSSGLRHLVLLGELFPQPSYLDEFIASFPHLETLLCAYNLYSPDIFLHLPPTVSSLTLCTPWGPKHLPIGECASALQRHCGRLPLLKSLVIVNCQTDRPEYTPLVEVCNAQGITFRTCNILNIDILGDALIRKR